MQAPGRQTLLFWASVPVVNTTDLAEWQKEVHSAENTAAYAAAQWAAGVTQDALQPGGAELCLLDMSAVASACGTGIDCVRDGIHRQAKVYMAVLQVWLNLLRGKLVHLAPGASNDCFYCAGRNGGAS